MTTKLKGLLCLFLTLGVCLTTANAQNPSVYAPSHPHQDPAFYVFGPDGSSNYGAEDSIQIIFVKVPAGSGSITLSIWDPGSGGSFEPASSTTGSKVIDTAFTVYGGAGAFSASKTTRPTADQAGTVLSQATYGKSKGRGWASLGTFDLAQGETVGDSTYFKIAAIGTSGSGGNFFKVGSSNSQSEIFAYDVTMHLAKDKREHTTIWVELPAGTTTLVEENYDLDEGGIPYFDGERLEPAPSGNWVTNRISITPREKLVRLPYDIDRTGRQDYSNGGFHFTDANGSPLRMFFRPEDEIVMPPAVPNNVCEIHTDLVHLVQAMPPAATLNSEFTYTITVTAKVEVANVVVTDRLPTNATFKGADPSTATRGGNNELVWNIGDMYAGESKTLSITVIPTQVGQIESCAIVKADPKCCVSTPVGEPKLRVTKTGPARTLNGSQVTYDITVTNTGSAAAHDVVLTDTPQAGLNHPDGAKITLPTIPILNVGESRSYAITFTAQLPDAQLPKEVCNTVVATAPDVKRDEDDQATACTLIEHYNVDIVKTGPETEFLGHVATYNIVVTNNGSSTLTDLVVTDTLPGNVTLTDADGGTVAGNTITWRIPSLEKGKTQSFKVAFSNEEKGTKCNRVAVTTKEGPRDEAEACTRWIGLPAMLIEVVDGPDPIHANETTTFVITATNQGWDYDQDIKITVQFNTALMSFENADMPDNATRAAQANAGTGTIVYEPYPRLRGINQAPDADGTPTSVTWRVLARAKDVNRRVDHRIKVTMETQNITPPVPEEESTTIY